MVIAVHIGYSNSVFVQVLYNYIDLNTGRPQQVVVFRAVR